MCIRDSNETLQARDDRSEALAKMEEANATMQGVVKSLEEEIDTRRGLQLEWGETKQDLVERVQLAREAVSDILSQHAELKQNFLGKWEESGERASSIERDLLECQKEKLEAEDRIRVLEREAEETTEKTAGMAKEIAEQKEKIGNLESAIEAKEKELDELGDNYIASLRPMQRQRLSSSRTTHRRNPRWIPSTRARRTNSRNVTPNR